MYKIELEKKIEEDYVDNYIDGYILYTEGSRIIKAGPYLKTVKLIGVKVTIIINFLQLGYNIKYSRLKENPWDKLFCTTK